MKFTRTTSQSGQILAIVALIMIALFAMLALIIDGGTAYANRRQAQNAADAGALAGARTLCMTWDRTEATNTATTYATSYNGATTADVNIDEDGMVNVTAKIPFNTFFAQLIGRPQMVAQAIASAGCFPPTTGERVLPVAWACRSHAPIGEGEDIDCEEKIITDTVKLNYYLENPTPPPPSTDAIWPELYIIMDSSSLPDDLYSVCQSQGGYLQCDLNGDGQDDLVPNGDRSWLDLNGGGGGAADLVNWVNGTDPVTIQAHTWTDGESGVANNVFQAVADEIEPNGKFFALPVFDMYCDNYPVGRCTVHPQDVILNNAVGKYYYHVIGFVDLYVTCVDAPGVPGPECPGHKYAVDLGLIDHNTKTIEGYFVKGILPNVGGGDPNGINAGVYTLKLYPTGP